VLREPAPQPEDVLDQVGAEIDAGRCFVRMLLAQPDVVEAAIRAATA